MTGNRVAIGLSGGVDSAVAAASLLEQGYRLTGVFMRLWDKSPSRRAKNARSCFGPGEEKNAQDARRVAAALGIPFVEVDLSEAFRRNVLDECASMYRDGRTPNPCVICNARLKFQALPEALRQRDIATDYFATGHYARVERNAQGRFVLRRGADRKKDQSYFLALLSQTQLSRALLPLGSSSKEESRERARHLGLPVASKPESQDFMAGGYHDLVDEDARPGPILDESGRVLGHHPGIVFFTIGQRRGLGISASHPLYVLQVDPARDVVVVGPAASLRQERFTVAGVNWVSVDPPSEPLRASVKIRYRHEAAPARVIPSENGEVTVVMDEPQSAVTPGQLAALYQGDLLLGGGIITAAFASEEAQV